MTYLNFLGFFNISQPDFIITTEGNNKVRSTLHWGPSYEHNRSYMTSESVDLDHDGFHVYTLELHHIVRFLCLQYQIIT